jgi:hypothetical protein
MSSQRPPGHDEPPRDSFPPDSEEEPRGDDVRARRRLEKIVREVIRRTVEKGVEAGIGTISKTDEAIRGVVGDVKLPREVVSYVFSAIDETKNSLVRGVAREVREFLEATDIAQELQRALTTLSFEIKTEIRFIPNESGQGVRPSVRARAKPKRQGRADDDDEDESEG